MEFAESTPTTALPNRSSICAQERRRRGLRPEDARRYYEEALAICRVVGDRAAEGTTLHNLGTLAQDLGHPEEARRYYEDALMICREVADRTGEGVTLNGLGALARDLGKPEQARWYLHEALAICRELGNRAGEGTTLHNLGTLAGDLGHPEEARRHFQGALTIYREVGERPGECATLHNLGAHARGLGQPEQARQYFQVALTISRDLGSRPLEGTTLHNLGTLAQDLGHPEEARRYCEDALMICREVADRTGEGVTLNGLGALAQDVGQPEQARRHYQDALAICRAVGNRTSEAATLHNLGILARSLGRPEEARRYLQDGLTISRDVADRALEGATLHSLGELCVGEENLAEACRHFAAAYEVYEAIREEILDDEARASFFEQAQDAFHGYRNALLIQYRRTPNGQAAEAFHIGERSRARALQDLLTEAPLRASSPVDATLVKRRQELLSRLVFAARQVSQSNLSEHERSAWIDRRGALDRELNDLELRLRGADPRFAALTRPTLLTLDQVQREVLDGNTVLLEFAVGVEESYLWAVTRDAYELHFLSGAVTLRGKVSDLFAAVLGRDAESTSIGAELYEMLVAPVAHLLTGKARVVVVPDDVLFYLPFELLVTRMRGAESSAVEPQSAAAPPASGESSPDCALPSQPSDRATARKIDVAESRSAVWAEGMPRPHYLLDDHAVVYAPSASVLATIRQGRASRQVGEKSFAGFAPISFHSPTAPTLRATEREVKDIANLFPSNQVETRLGPAASKKAVLGCDLHAYRYVHFATHGYLDADKPRFCGLLFREDDDDALLHTFELMQLDLAADLVVASACQTGLGRLRQGEGMMGLQRAFFYAGTPSVSVSLWSVNDDSTADLMARFYHHLVKGKLDKAEALRQAKRDLLKTGRWTDPFYWAPFVLVGDGREWAVSIQLPRARVQKAVECRKATLGCWPLPAANCWSRKRRSPGKLPGGPSCPSSRPAIYITLF